MDGRKPPGVTWEAWIDAVVREGRERGEFDDLAGAGQPIEGLGESHDELWWVRKKLKDEGLSYLPPALVLRKDREDTLARIMTMSSERTIRQTLEELNERIRSANSRPMVGPPSTVMVVDIDEVLNRWRTARDSALADGPSAASDAGSLTPPSTTSRSPRSRSWRRRHHQ